MENNKKREMTQEELDMIVGGYIPNTPPDAGATDRVRHFMSDMR